jgi:hypothetical protein
LRALSSAQCWVVPFVHSHRRNDPYDSGTPTHTYHLHLTYHLTHITTLALINETTHLDPLVPLSTQLDLLNLFDGDEIPYEFLHAVISCGVKPQFDAFVGTKAGAGKDAGGGAGETKLRIPMTKKTFAGLGLSLFHLQQNVESPETNLVVYLVIQQAVELVGSLFL